MQRRLYIICRIIVPIVLFIADPKALAQTQTQTQSQYDIGTPPQFVSGVSPFGSYASTDFDNVNLSNGTLNFTLPLGQVGGRGLTLPIALNYSSKVWSAGRGLDDDPSSDPGNPRKARTAHAMYGEASNYVDTYNQIRPGWMLSAAPLLRARGMGINPIVLCTSTATAQYQYALVKLSLIIPGEGEIQLRDDQTDGAVLSATTTSCASYDGYRGRRWHATDGSGAVFISDNDNGVARGDLQGTLITADGTRYRFGNIIPGTGNAPIDMINILARCTSVTDRQGNTIQFSYPNDYEMDCTDPLGRMTRIQKDVADPDNPSVTLALLVTLPGYQGQPRYYKVKIGIMNQNYRAIINPINPVLPVITGDYFPIGGGSPLPGPHTSLFPLSYGREQIQLDTKGVVTELVLPDGRSLHFAYNEFGEVAEVTLLTGGKIQYDYAYASALPSGNSDYWEVHGVIPSDVSQIDRAVVARRTYPNGTTLEGRWTYVYGPQTFNNTSYPCAEMTAYAPPPANTTLLNQRHFFLTGGRYNLQTTAGPNGTGYTLWSTGLEWRTETRDTAGVVISATERDWAQRAGVLWPVIAPFGQEQPENDNRVSQTRIYLNTGGYSKVETFYDNVNNVRANNVTEVKEYDFDLTLKRRTVTSYLVTNPNNGSLNYAADNIFLLRLPVQQSVYNPAGAELARTVYQYDKYVNDGNNAGLTDYGSSVTGHDTAYGTGKTTRGNVTAIGRWLNTTGTTLFTYSRYDTLGNGVSIKDANGNVTTISYTDNFGNGSNPGSGAGGTFGATYAFPTLLTSPDPGNGYGVHTARSQYDFNTGLLTGFRDRNNIITQTIYNDPFNRPTLIKSALNQAGVETHRAIYYAPTTVFGVVLDGADVLTANDQNTVGDANLRSWTQTDGFGRTIENWTRDPQGDVKVATIYDALGRASQRSNPYRPSAGESPLYTTIAYDTIGRMISMTTPDNAVVTTSYNGNQTLVTDQAGRKHISRVNALGQLVNVWEVTPNDTWTVTVNFNGQNYTAYQTDYKYDALNNLMQVTQGAQNRYFLYDSLSRLIRVRIPEQAVNTSLALNPTPVYNGQPFNNSWSLGYTYDANSNVLSRTDANNVTASYTYDVLNRNKMVTYSNYPNGTFYIERYYDGATNGKGRFWYDIAYNYRWEQATDNLAYHYTHVNTYDALGRPLSRAQEFLTKESSSGSWVYKPYPMSRTYDLAGNVTSQTYPSGRVVVYSYDTAGRTSDFIGELGSGGVSRNYARSISYNAADQITSETFGTQQQSLYHRRRYNNRFQLYDVRLGTGATDDGSNATFNRGLLRMYYASNYAYGDGGLNNNGNLYRMDHFVPGNDSISTWTMAIDYYGYDDLNRITAIAENKQNNTTGETGVFSQTYVMDRWGNRSIASSTVPGIATYNYTFDVVSNRLNAIDGVTVEYDSNGNQRYDGSVVSDRWYDAENRMTKALQGITSYYYYDADGQRVRRMVNNQETWLVYGFEGELLAEYNYLGLYNPAPALTSPLKEYGYRNGQLLIVADSSAALKIEWLVTDHLGTPRINVRGTGTNGGALASITRHDYLPFGEEILSITGYRSACGCYMSDGVRQKFDGYERDSETGLDFAQARYFSSLQGRFTSVDPIYFQAKMTSDPQRFNLYTQARNNPLKFVDPSGEAIRLSNDKEQRELELQHLRDIVGKEAGAYLYENKVEVKDKEGNVIGYEYYVGIYTNGPNANGPAFDQINEPAGELANIIKDEKIVDFMVSGRADILFDENKNLIFRDRPTEIGSYEDGRKPGATGHINGQLTVVVYDGYAGEIPGRLMEGGRPSDAYPGEIAGHELGHARDFMTGRDPRSLMGLDAGSIRFENKVRKLYAPTTPIRKLEQ